jgi:hypothetical protein
MVASTGTMRTMKAEGRPVARLLLVVMAAALAMIAASRASAVTVRMPSDLAAPPGSILHVPVLVSSANGVVGFNLQIGYPDAALQYLGTEKGGLTAAWSIFEVNQTPGNIAVASINFNALSGKGSLAVVRFRVRENATVGAIVPLQFFVATLNDGIIPVTTVDGSIEIGEAPYISAPADLSLWPGQQIIVPIQIDDASGILGAVFEIRYDSQHFNFVSITPGDILSQAGWGAFEVDSSTPYVRVATAGLQELQGGGTLLNLRLHANPTTPDGTVATVYLETASLNDGGIRASTGNADITIFFSLEGVAIGSKTGIAMLIVGLCLLAWRGVRVVHGNQGARRA